MKNSNSYKGLLKKAIAPISFGIIIYLVQINILADLGFYPQLFFSTILGMFIGSTGYFGVGLSKTSLVLNTFVLINLLDIFGDEIIGRANELLNSGHFWQWQSSFDYVYPTIVLMIWVSCVIFCIFVRISQTGENDTSRKRKYFTRFFSSITPLFALFYVLVLATSLIFFRIDGQNHTTSIKTNLIPFNMLAYYFDGDLNSTYKKLTLFFGNVFMFTPLGFYYRCKLMSFNKIKIMMIPLAISLFVELIQLIFKIGHCDIDDLILNCLGFYIGIVIKDFFDYIRYKRTDGEEKTIFSK